MHIKRLMISAVALVLVAPPLFADEEIDEIRAQIKTLEARLDALEKKKVAAAQNQGTAPATASASAAVVPATVVTPPPAQPAVMPAAANAVGTGAAPQPQSQSQSQSQQAEVQYKAGQGLTVTSADNNFQFHVGGYVQADDHNFLGDTPSGNTDQFFIRSARPIFEARFYDNFSARLMLDYGNGQTTLVDAYGDYNAADAFNIRVGKFKDPIGIERWQSEQDILFVERGMTTNLVPYRDNGVQIYGKPLPGSLEYQVALTNGAPDQVNATNNTDNGQNVTARIFAHPLYATGIDALKGFGVGVAGSYGNRGASLANPDLTTGYVTPAQTKFFTYSTSAFADGEQWRLNPQAMYYNGPFSLIGEYVLEDQGVRSGTVQDTLSNKAWEAITTYVLTGEDARFDGVVPKYNFDPKLDQWGAFELAARVSALYIDKAAFPVLASLATSADAAREMTLGGNWYLNRNVKLNLDFALTSFDGGAVGNASRPEEKAVLSRVQFKF